MNICVQFTNPFVLIYLIGTFVSLVINMLLEGVDYKARVKNGGKLPPELAENQTAQQLFDTQKLAKISEYENAKYFVWIPSSIVTFIVDIALVVFGFYPWVFNLVTGWFGFSGTIGSSFVCFALFTVISSIPAEIISLPFSLYNEFHTEKKFGFSNMTVKLWIADQIKNLIVSLILGALLIFAASVFFVKCPSNWWWILAAGMICFTFIFQIIYPKFIAPLFNKFEPLPEGELKQKISEILEKTGFKNGGLFVMDESKRSGHSNAYFSGFGKSKRIVLYDTLIKSLSSDELAAVLGHELGHFKLKHITKRLFILIPLEFVLMLALFILAQFPGLYEAFGFFGITAENVSQFQFIGLFLAVTIYGSVSEILSPIANFSSRRNEYAADEYAAKICGTSEHLITGLIKLNNENLKELLPPPIYVFWNYSHPTLCERIKNLQKK